MAGSPSASASGDSPQTCLGRPRSLAMSGDCPRRARRSCSGSRDPQVADGRWRPAYESSDQVWPSSVDVHVTGETGSVPKLVAVTVSVLPLAGDRLGEDLAGRGRRESHRLNRRAVGEDDARVGVPVLAGDAVRDEEGEAVRTCGRRRGSCRRAARSPRAPRAARRASAGGNGEMTRSVPPCHQ